MASRPKTSTAKKPVAIIMGSQSDWATMQHAAETLDRLPHRTAWVEEVAAELNQGDEAVYAGFLADEGEVRVRAAYPPANWERLTRVKAEYDPDNLFRFNQNIPPAG